jgi:hypothetical protein
MTATAGDPESLVSSIEETIASNRKKMEQLAALLEGRNRGGGGGVGGSGGSGARLVEFERLDTKPTFTEELGSAKDRRAPRNPLKPQRSPKVINSSNSAVLAADEPSPAVIADTSSAGLLTATASGPFGAPPIKFETKRPGEVAPATPALEQHSFKNAAKRLTTVSTLRDKLLNNSLISHQRSIDNDGPWSSLIDVVFVLNTVFSCMIVITLWHPLSRINFSSNPPFPAVGYFAFQGIVSLVWVALRFFIRIRRGWEIIDDVRVIRKYYMQTWFPFDMVICCPFELLFIGWFNPVFYVMILRHFLRYMRLIDLGNSTNPLLPSRAWFRFVTFLATMCLVAHAVGNIFWSIQHRNDPTLTYVKSLYWSVATMVTVGYGDIVPTGDQGRMFAIFSAMLGVVIISTFTAASTHFATATDTLTEELNNRKATMYAMMKHYHVPWAVQREVIQIFPAALTNYTEQQFKQHLEVLPKFMQSKLLGYFNAGLLRELPVFQGVGQEVLLQLSSKMSKRYVPQADLVFEAGEKADELIFIIHGVIDLITTRGDEVVLVEQLRDGAVFGEEAMLDDDAERLLTAQCTTNCEVVVLQRHDFLHVMKHNKDVLSKLQKKTSLRKSVVDFSTAPIHDESGEETET